MEDLEALGPVDGPPSIDPLRIPPGTLCYVSELAGEVWFWDRPPQRQWLRDAEEDAYDATS